MLQGHLIADAAALRKAAAARAGPNSLMLFKGCPRPLGCTILLKGSDPEELARVKRVAAFAAYAAYWNRLEAEVLADQLASAAAAAGVLRGTSTGGIELQPVQRQQQAAAGGEAEEQAQPAEPSSPAAAAAAAGGVPSGWPAMVAACAQASAQAAAQHRGRLIVSASPHVTFVGDEDGEEGGPSEGRCGEEGQSPGRSSAPSTSAASVASSPTKSVAAAAAGGGLADAAQPPPSAASTAAERDQAVVRNLLLAEDSDPWVVPADANGATVTISGHPAAPGPHLSAAAALLCKSGSTASLRSVGGSSAAAAVANAAAGSSAAEAERPVPDSPQLDPLSRAVQELERQRLAEEEDGDDGSSEGGESGAAASEATAGPVPPLAPINTLPSRSGTATAGTSPRAAQPAAGSVADGSEAAGPGGAGGGAPSPDSAAGALAAQELWVSISCKNPAKSILCEPPHTHCMHYYAREGGWCGAAGGCLPCGAALGLACCQMLLRAAALLRRGSWVCADPPARLPCLPLQTCRWRTSWLPPRPPTASARTPPAARARCCTCAASCTATGWSPSPLCACRRGRSFQVGSLAQGGGAACTRRLAGGGHRHVAGHLRAACCPPGGVVGV